MVTQFKNRSILILFLAIVFVLSTTAVTAQEVDGNQTDSLEIEVPAEDNTQEVLSAPSSTSQNSDSNNQNSTSAFLVLDNDADEENVNIGDYVTWILGAQNFGPDVAKNVKIYDKLPEGMKYIKHTATKGTFNPKTGIWNIGDLTVEEGVVTLSIVTQALTAGEKINEAYITSDTNNTNNITFEEEEIDVESSENSGVTGFVYHASAGMYESGNPVFLILIAILTMAVPIIKR